MRTSSFILAAILLAAGCSKRPEGILSEKEMVSLMADIQIAEAMEESGRRVNTDGNMDRELLGRGVLLAHGVSMEQMDSTLAWYGRNMDEYAKLYKKVDEELRRRQTRYGREAGETENAGPSSDLWPYGRNLVLTDQSLTDGIVAVLPGTDVAPGDKLTWKMRASGGASRTMTLGVDYEDGSTSIVRNTSGNSFDKWMETSLQTDSTLTVSGIFAVLNVDGQGKKVFLDSIRLTHQPMKIDEYHHINYQRRVGAPAHKVILPPDTAATDTVATKPLPLRATKNLNNVK